MNAIIRDPNSGFVKLVEGEDDDSPTIEVRRIHISEVGQYRMKGWRRASIEEYEEFARAARDAEAERQEKEAKAAKKKTAKADSKGNGKPAPKSAKSAKGGDKSKPDSVPLRGGKPKA